MGQEHRDSRSGKIHALELVLKWPWVKTYGAIFGWMNIHLPSILMFTRCQGFDPLPYITPWGNRRKTLGWHRFRSHGRDVTISLLKSKVRKNRIDPWS